MKPFHSFAMLAAIAAVSQAFAVEATTTPVGYYGFAGQAGGNIFVPGLVNPAAFSGVLTAANSTPVETPSTLTLAANSLVSGAYNQGGVYATHYVEITSGPNAGVALDIVSNTSSVITLADNVAELALTGSETIKIRPHVTLKSALVGAEASLVGYADYATFLLSDGTTATYYYGADGGTGWSSDFSTADGNLRPILPGTGFVLGLTGPGALTVSGEVNPSPTVVMLAAGKPSIVGLVNPLAGASTSLNTTGFETLTAYADSITVYVAGALVNSVTYYPLGDGTVSSDLATPTTDTISNTTGAVVLPTSPVALKLQPGFTVAQ